MKIKAGDTVEVIQGDDIGMRGTVRRVDVKKKRIVVEGVNIVTKHLSGQVAFNAGDQFVDTQSYRLAERQSDTRNNA